MQKAANQAVFFASSTQSMSIFSRMLRWGSGTLPWKAINEGMLLFFVSVRS